MKTIINRFYSKDDKDSLEMMDNIFNRKGIFFIESKETHFWIEELTPLGPVMTSDPLKAMRFETLGQAMIFRVQNNLTEPTGWITTEHEFPEPKKP